MSVRLKLLSALLCSSLVLVGCGGGGDGDTDVNIGGGSGGNLGGGGSSGGSSGGSGGDTGGDTGGDSGGDADPNDPFDLTSNVSYLNLQVCEGFDDFSGEGVGGLFQGNGEYNNAACVSPYIDKNVITPVDAFSLSPVSTATVADYVTTVNDIEVDAAENYPKLQRVIGAPVFLRTALVFDLSDSIRATGVDDAAIDALVAEAKAYVAAAQASADETIANQEFVVWAFARDIVELTAGFTSDASTINTALDGVDTRFADLTLGTTSNLHRAIVQVTGRYSTDDYDFSIDGDNDLVDSVRPDFSALSQMVVFSAGNDTFAEMEQQLMINAIQSQAFDVFDTSAGDLSATTRLYKPVFYYVLGGSSDGTEYAALSENAETVTTLSLNAGSYSFAAGLIQNQQDAIAARVDVDSQYVYSYAFLPRIGEHTNVFSTNTTGYSYSLTSQYDEDNLDPAAGSAAEVMDTLLEITGPNGEYLARTISINLAACGGAGDFVATNTASLADVSTFAPATRWIAETYEAADYSWAIVAGTGTGTTNADGTYTVTGKTSPTITLRLTNDTLGASGSPFSAKNTAEIIIGD